MSKSCFVFFQKTSCKFYCNFWVINPFSFWSKTITWCSRFDAFIGNPLNFHTMIVLLSTVPIVKVLKLVERLSNFVIHHYESNFYWEEFLNQSFYFFQFFCFFLIGIYIVDNKIFRSLFSLFAAFVLRVAFVARLVTSGIFFQSLRLWYGELLW